MVPLVALLALSLPPAAGEKAPAFELMSLDRQVVRLRDLRRRGPVVLVVLRGWPGYQCPFCTRQVGELLTKSDDFGRAKAEVVLVYPGPAEGLEGHASEFVSGKDLPKRFHLTLDKDYAFTKSYGLRWDAAGETAYPSTFVIGKNGRIVYAKVSKSHGDRAPVADVLKALG